ncbi:type VI secretion system lipoprotein TssJ [Aquincola sp. MAHUQ-54]|uniref:Type VI secretion system lipoprotein TssJ n=1 Tax=Aquincola agrisoli TaxID=3119538 RepID=A0AAW9PZC6_9BURK
MTAPAPPLPRHGPAPSAIGRRRWLLGACGAGATLAGCGAYQGAKQLAKAALYPSVEVLKIDVHADAIINPDDRGGALPVTVRIYQLGAREEIERAGYADLVGQDRTVLGATLLQRYEFVAYPGESAAHAFPIKPEVRFIALLAVMRKPPAPAYLLLDAMSFGTRGITLAFDRDRMVLAAGPKPLERPRR